MTDSELTPEFRAAKEVDPATDDKDYQDYLAWKNRKVEPLDTVTEPPVAESTSQKRGWKGGELAKPAPKPEVEDDKEPEWYIHLADGSVERVAESDLPGRAGSHSEFGHWERDGKVYTIIGVHPAEVEVKKG